MAPDESTGPDMETVRSWWAAVAEYICKELGFVQIIGPRSAYLPIPVDEKTLRLDNSDPEGRYSFEGPDETMAALRRLARLHRAYWAPPTGAEQEAHERGDDEPRDFANFNGVAIQAAMDRVEEDLTDGILLLTIHKPWTR